MYNTETHTQIYYSDTHRHTRTTCTKFNLKSEKRKKGRKGGCAGLNDKSPTDSDI